MSDEKEKKKKGLFSSILELSFIKKLKSIKHIEIIILVIFVLILLLICFSGQNTFSFFKNDSQTSSLEETNNVLTRTSDYKKQLESELKSLISSIKDVKNVEVLVSLKSSVELELAKDETTITSSSKVETNNKIILIEQNKTSVPIILKETLPEIESIVIVAGGAEDVNTRLSIITAVQTLFNINANKIEVIIGK